MTFMEWFGYVISPLLLLALGWAVALYYGRDERPPRQ